MCIKYTTEFNEIHLLLIRLSDQFPNFYMHHKLLEYYV
jgi:hypothetical protein